MTHFTQKEYRDEIERLADEIVSQAIADCHEDDTAPYKFNLECYNAVIKDHILEDHLSMHKWIEFMQYYETVFTYSYNTDYLINEYGERAASMLYDAGKNFALRKHKVFFAMYGDILDRLPKIFNATINGTNKP